MEYDIREAGIRGTIKYSEHLCSRYILEIKWNLLHSYKNTQLIQTEAHLLALSLLCD